MKIWLELPWFFLQCCWKEKRVEATRTAVAHVYAGQTEGNCSLSNAHSRYWYRPVWHTDTEIDLWRLFTRLTARRPERISKGKKEGGVGIFSQVVIWLLRPLAKRLAQTSFSPFFLLFFTREGSFLASRMEDYETTATDENRRRQALTGFICYNKSEKMIKL